MGFEDEYELCRMQLTVTSVAGESRGSTGISPPSLSPIEGLSIRPMLEEDLAKVAEADRRIFGADRREVLRWAFP